MSTRDSGPATIHDVLRRAGVQYDHYKLTCIERRIAARMRVRRVATYDEYVRVLQDDPEEAKRLENALTINVSRFFRNWVAFRELGETVVPELWRRDTAPVRIWSAGCAAGEEAYSLAALFHAFAERVGDLDRVRRIEVIGSDIDERSLAVAERGVYSEATLSETPQAYRERYFTSGPGTVRVVDELRPLVRFEKRDLVLDREPWAGFDLIVCRNVIIYLDGHAQQALLARFHRCSTAGAYLMLGKVEAVLGPARELFQAVNIRTRIYRRRP